MDLKRELNDGYGCAANAIIILSLVALAIVSAKASGILHL